jgi:5-methylcytosine-specific restriction enzyme subunit McrC
VGVGSTLDLKYVDLREAERTFIPGDVLLASAAQLLSDSKRFEVSKDISRDGYWVASRGWIGQFPVQDNTILRVAPKVPVGNLFWMLDVAYRLQSFHVFEGHVEGIATFPQLFERLASLFASRVEARIRKGVARGYETFVESLPVVRGRVVFSDPSRLLAQSTLLCEFEEQTADTDDNRILVWALYLIGRMRLREASLATRIRKAFFALSGGVSLVPKLPGDCVNRRYTRLTSDYQPLHVLARFFIEHSGPSLQHGESSTVPFAVSMPHLFEAFVAEALTVASHGRYEIQRQWSIAVSSSFGLEFRIDLALRPHGSDTVSAVLDTKYKSLPPTEADIYQIVAYALQVNATKAFLIYPVQVPMQYSARIGNVEVHAVGIDLAALPIPNVPQLLGDIEAKLI